MAEVRLYENSVAVENQARGAAAGGPVPEEGQEQKERSGSGDDEQKKQFEALLI